MSVLYLLIGLSLILALVFLFAFVRALRSGQFDDGYTPAVRILFDDDEKPKMSDKWCVQSDK